MKFFSALSIRSFLLILFSIFATQVFAQAVGDYRSNSATMNWSQRNRWQRWDGTVWATPTLGQGYPGQNTGTGLVTIRNGHTVTLNVTPVNSIGSLIVGGGTTGTLILGNGGGNDDLTVSGNVIVNTGATITTGDDGVFTIGGNLINNNVFDLNNGGSVYDVVFNGNANQTFSGTGGTSDFNDITINNTGAANNNIVEIMPSNFTTVAGFLTLTQGIIKMSGTYTFANTFITAVSSLITINSNAGIWLNNANVTVTAQNSDTELSGLIRVTQGTYNSGTLADWWLYYNTGATLMIEGGALNVSGAFFGYLLTDAITYNQSGGVFTVNTGGNTGTFGAVPSFGIEATGSVFSMSGGSIVLQRIDDAYTDYINLSTSATVTGGTLQVGNTSSPSPTFNYWVNSTPPLYNLTVNTTNSPTAEIRTNVTVLNDVTIGIGAGIDASTLNNNLIVGRHFTNNGTFTQQAATVTFNGTVLQNINGTSNTIFYNLAANNTAGNTTTGITLQRPTTVTNILTLTSGHITTDATNLLTMNAGSSVAGASYFLRRPKFPIDDNSFVNGPMRKIGNTDFLFPVGKVMSGFNRGMRYCGVSSNIPGTATDAFTAEFISGSATLLGAVAVSGLDHVSRCEYWDIARAPGSRDADVVLSWSPLSPCNMAPYVNDPTTLVAAHFGAGWDSFGGTVDPGPGMTPPYSSGSITWAGVTTFSPFSLGSTSSATNPLPVKLVDVKAYRSGNRNKIEWTNLTEIDVVAYEVEKSLNGTQFTSMASLAARSNANDKQSYFEYDVQPASVTYYRIKVTSRDGEIVYSPIVKVTSNLSVMQDIVLYPNPITGKQFTMQMNSAAGNYFVKIYAANGQIVKTEAFTHPGGSYSKTIELPGQLQAGQYYMQVSGGEKNLTSKFIVQ